MDGFSTRATHGAGTHDDVQEHPLSPPIWQVADYAFETAQHYADVISGRRAGQVYGRYGNPTLEALAENLASLEQAEAAWGFSSGMAAIHATLMLLASSGDRVVAGRSLYGGTYGLFTEGAKRAGIQVAFADATKADSVAEAVSSGGAVGVFIEMIANPTMEVADIEGIAILCETQGIPLVVDNTIGTPALINPIGLGADLVVHSTSKYIGGHHDLMGGIVAGTQFQMGRLRELGIRYGTTASALESWLALRGLATLGLRMQRHSSNSLAIAQFLEDDPSIKSVLHPGLASHPQHERAKRLLRDGGGMLSVDLGSQEPAWRFIDALRLVKVGSSFGGVRSEACHPATTSHRQFSPEDRLAAGISDGLVRISVGIEDEEDLIQDFQRASRML